MHWCRHRRGSKIWLSGDANDYGSERDECDDDDDRWVRGQTGRGCRRVGAYGGEMGANMGGWEYESRRVMI